VLNLQEKRETAPKAPSAVAPEAVKPVKPAQPERPAPARPADTGNDRTHTVAPGETLYGISRQYGISLESLREANQLGNAPISVGQVLRIPTAETPKPATPAEPKFHDVQPGETAYSIARKYGISLDDLQRWNNLPDFVMRTGMRLRVSQ
jgi:membrane-bound lytic murein transglycosylase D